jgi:phosphoribosylaminoimidazolecarboxamide formyltransferase/IMP cyclohydrolase
MKLPPFDSLPKFLEDGAEHVEVKVFDDGSIILATPYLSRVKGPEDLVPAYCDHAKKGRIDVTRQATERELDDMLFAWYVNIHVRSNGVVIAKNGQTLAVGTGEQDRVGAVRQALEKAKTKYSGDETLEGAVLASDGFFPFADSIEAATAAGVGAIVQPGGSVQDFDVIDAVNKAGATMVFTLERCFSHH